MNKNNTIFLNIDSIMFENKQLGSYYDKNQQSSSLLEQVLQVIPSIRVVITSPWAIGKKYDFFIEYLHTHNNYNLFKLILQFLHSDCIILPFEEDEPRGASIDFWISKHLDEINNYLCIDNTFADYLEWNPVLLIDSNTGFKSIDVELIKYFFLVHPIKKSWIFFIISLLNVMNMFSKENVNS